MASERTSCNHHSCTSSQGTGSFGRGSLLTLLRMIEMAATMLTDAPESSVGQVRLSRTEGVVSLENIEPCSRVG
jgi:hypothetical protein